MNTCKRVRAHLERLLEVALLIGVDRLEHRAAREDNRVVLVVALPVAENRVARQLDLVLGLPTAAALVELAAAVDHAAEEAAHLRPVGREFRRVFLVDVRDLCNVCNVCNVFLVEVRDLSRSRYVTVVDVRDPHHWELVQQ